MSREPYIPGYLTKEFLEKLLEDNENSKAGGIQIVEYDIANPLPKGANYLSNILKIKIKYFHTSDTRSNLIKNISLIAKLPLQGAALSSAKKAGINEKEVKAYRKLLPKMNTIMNQEDNVDILPKYFTSHMIDAVFLEDLGVIGYKMADKTQQLDYAHGLLVMKHLAKFHAASVKLHETEPEIVEELGTDSFICKDMVDEIKKIMDVMMGEAHIEMVCNEFNKWPETRKFVDFLSKLKPKVWDLLINAINPSDGEFTVLNHGDLWVNNILFQYDDDLNPKNLKFLDFQILRYTSPTMDIIHFLHSSVRYDVLKSHYEDLTRIYLESLNLNLEKYGSTKRLEYDDFRRSLEKRDIFALIQCVNILPFIFAKYEDSNNETEEINVEMFLENEVYRSVCAKYLEDFSKKSWYKTFE